MLLGLDYAGGRPGGAAIAAAGYSFCCRYLTPGGPGLPGKQLTAEEYADLHAHGVAVVANWETTATRMLEGHDAGVADARNAVAWLAKLGHPNTRPIYFSADFDASPAQQAEIDDYLRGCATVIGADGVGVYGGYWVVKRCLDNHTAAWAWQASAWSPTRPDGSRQIDPRAHIFQHIATAVVGGVECDINIALRRPDFGQHPHHRRDDMTALPATAPPQDPNSDPASWPQRNYNVEFTPDTGWSCVFGVQDWPGRTADSARGFLRLASWEFPDGHLVPISGDLSTAGKGVAIYNHAPTVAFTAPPGAEGLTVNYAAPGGAEIGT